MKVFVDIDGTLADGSERFALAGPEPDRVNKKAYLKWLADVQDEARLARDPVIRGSRDVVHALKKAGYSILYLTSREHKYQEVTKSWLLGNNFPDGDLVMRPNGDWRSSHDLKKEVILQHVSKVGGELALDDDPTNECEPMYRALSITHLKVTWCRGAWGKK